MVSYLLFASIIPKKKHQNMYSNMRMTINHQNFAFSIFRETQMDPNGDVNFQFDLPGPGGVFGRCLIEQPVDDMLLPDLAIHLMVLVPDQGLPFSELT